MKYHEKGRRLYFALEAEARLQIIDCLNGKAEHAAPLKCEREQIYLVEPTHHEQCVLIAGKGSITQPIGQRHAVSYWSLHENKLLRKFRGHGDAVTGLSMCPADDTFLSSSKDRTVRLWNVQQAGCIAQLKLPVETENDPLAVFDSTGLVFLCTANMTQGNGHYVHLYDARNYGSGAFAELKVTREDLEKAIHAHNGGIDMHRANQLSRGDWKTATFNKSGSQILIGAENGMSIILDGFEGTVQSVILEASKRSDRPAVSCFSSDDKTIITGNDDGTLSCVDLASGTVVRTLQGHLGRVNAVACNPEYTQMTSCCTQTAIWLW